MARCLSVGHSKVLNRLCSWVETVPPLDVYFYEDTSRGGTVSIGGCLFQSQAGQVVVVFAFLYTFGFETALCRIETEGLEVDVEPVKGVTLHRTVLHLEVDFAVVVAGQVDEEAAILVFEQVAKVARVHQDAATRTQKLFHAGEEGRQVLELADDARTVHQHQDGVEGIGKGRIEQVGQAGFLHASFFLDFHGAGRDVDGAYFVSHFLEGEGMAAAAGSYVEDASPGELQGGLFQGRHLLQRAEELADRNLVFLKLRGKHAQALGTVVFEIVRNGGAHRVFVGGENGCIHEFLFSLVILFVYQQGQRYNNKIKIAAGFLL